MAKNRSKDNDVDEKEEKEEKGKKEKKSIYLTADYILDRPKKIVSASVLLDPILNGGVPESTLMLISGNEKIGKTSLALKIIANAQRMGKVGIIADVEHRLKVMNLKGIKGLDVSPDKLKIIRSQEGDILSGEEILTRAEQCLHDFPGCVLLVDSFSSLSPAAEQAKAYGDGLMAARAKLEAEFCRKIAPIIAVNNNIIIGIAHIASNIGGYGNVEKVGKVAKYQLDIRLRCKMAEKTPDWLSDGVLVGHKIHWTAMTTALGKRGGEATTHLRYGIGIDDVADIIALAAELGVIEKGGSWYTLHDGQKAQGFDAIYNIINQDEKLFKEIEKRVKELVV